MARRIEFSDTKVKYLVYKGVSKGRYSNNALESSGHVQYTKPNGVKENVEETKLYRYLGMLVDQRLDMKQWCAHIAKEV